MPAALASRKRSFDMHPATARYSSCPPLNPRPPPPPSVGRSTTRVNASALPTAVTWPPTFWVSTSMCTCTPCPPRPFHHDLNDHNRQARVQRASAPCIPGRGAAAHLVLASQHRTKSAEPSTS